METPPSTQPSPNGLTPEVIDAALKGILADGGVIPLSMKTDTASMLPTLHPGQRVAVARAGDRLRRGELLLFRKKDEERAVHRYLGPARSADGAPRLRTRGDGNPYLDAPLDPERVLGRVVGFERDGAWWDLDGRAARLYGLGAALHDLFWAVAAHVLAKLDGLLRRPQGLFRPLIVGCDRGLLVLAHRIFLLFARRRAAPKGASEAAPTEPGPGAPGPQ